MDKPTNRELKIMLKNQNEKLDRLIRVVEGNGNMGIIGRLRRLENRYWWVIGIGSCIVAIMSIISFSYKL